VAEATPAEQIPRHGCGPDAIVESVDIPAPRPDQPTILVADDEPAMRSLIERALTQRGLRVILAADGREALDLLARHHVDVALLDLNMPILGGLETLRRIRADARYRTIRVIVITGSDTETARVSGLERGADDWLAKPFSLNELHARIGAQLRGRSVWSQELERGREKRQQLAAALDRLPRNEPLPVLTARLIDQIVPILGLDGAAILHFPAGSVRTVASTGDLARTFRPVRSVSRERTRTITTRAEAGAWIERLEPEAGPQSQPLEVAYVPFRIGPSPKPLGCIAFAVRVGAAVDPLAHRLPDLIEATDFIVAVLRPAVEEAELTGIATVRLERVIARHEFDIHLQPISRLADGTVVAVEALTRFRSEMRPDLQFAEAASLGLGAALQRATLTAAVEAAADLPPTVALSVNVSADLLEREPALAAILGAAERRIIVEITEHERIDDYDAVKAGLERLGSNVQLAVDDAGSGYASLRHILTLQPAYVKLDIEWVREIDRDPVRRALVSGLIYFASETNCELIAEGIETQAELDVLRDLGIRLGQGYLLGRPMPAPGGSPASD
jgi:EAL domain-containing protein (putative c-di-GMP-specific phosphodiesterase class I)/DNA-binding NarL/FixJ family response regulator